MPSKKQRRRREKTFRHEYDLVVVDEEGHEVPVDHDERRAERAAKTARRNGGSKSSRGGTPTGKNGRPVRKPPEPSWRRAFKRGGLMGGLMLLTFVFVFKSQPLATRIVWGVAYAVAFVPLTYLIDRTAYRSYQRRIAGRNTAGRNAAK